MNTYQITREQYEATAAKIGQANARAAKKGLAGLLTIEGTSVIVTAKDEITGIERAYEMVDVVLGGEAPKYDGWTFVATLDWDANAGLIVRTAPGIVAVDRTDLVQGKCDHCNVNRYRNETYLLRHDDGRQVQVGSTCIKDFLGITVNVAWLDGASIMEELDGFGFDSGPRSNGTNYVLALAWALIKLDGFRPASGGGVTTKSDVLSILYPPRIVTNEYRNWASRVRVLADEAVERAAEIRAFILSDEFEGNSEYVRNLKSIAAADLVSDRNVGMLVSAPQAWARHLERTLIRNAAEQMKTEWVGAKGDKIAVTVTIKGVRFIQQNFGTTVLYTMVDGSGNLYKWFASREALGDKVEETFTIKATIKDHDEFKGVKATVLTRAKQV